MVEIIFQGPEGKLEGRYHASKSSPAAPIALILPQHPSISGHMNDALIYTLFHTFAELGFSVLRFNYRGVGHSTGIFDAEEAMADAAAALDWLQTMNKEFPTCYVAGASFGSYVAFQLLMRRPEIVGFIALCPTVNQKDFSFLTPCPVSGLVLQGTEDVIVPENMVATFADRLSHQKRIVVDYKTIKGADHFFKSKHKEVMKALMTYLASVFKNAPKRVVGKGKKIKYVSGKDSEGKK